MPTLRYPARIGAVLRPAGTTVEIVSSTDAQLQRNWPGITEKPGSCYVPVRVPGETAVTIVMASQLVEHV